MGSTRWVILILILALLIRLGAAMWWQQRVSDGFGFPDSDSYWYLAGQIVDGKPYQYRSEEARVFRAPGFPILLAGWFGLYGNRNPPVWYARGLPILLGTLSVGFVILLGRLLFGISVGLLAGIVVAVHPEALGMSVFLLSEGPFCPFFLGQIIALVQMHRADKLRTQIGWATIVGLLAGLATLVRPSWLLFTPIAGVLWMCSSPLRRLLPVGAMLAALVCVMLPWWIRNAHVANVFVPTTLQVGASLYDGLHPAADGSSHMDFVPEFREQARFEYQPQRDPPFEVFVDRAFRDAAVAWAREHPDRVLELAWTKFARMWNFWPNEPGLRSWPMRMLVMLGLVPVLLLSGFAIWMYRDQVFVLAWLWLPAVYFTGLHMIFVGSIRYRQPALLPLIILASAAGWTLYQRFAQANHVKEAR